MKSFVVAFLFLLSIISVHTYASPWHKIEGEHNAAKDWNISCEEGSGWQRCGNQKGGLYLVLTSYAGGGVQMHIHKGVLPSPEEDQIIYCDASASSVVQYTDYLIKRDAGEVSTHAEYLQKFVPERFAPFCRGDLFVGFTEEFYLNPADPYDQVNENGSIVNVHFGTHGRAPPAPENTMVCSERDYSTRSMPNGAFADRHYFCSRTALAGTHISFTPHSNSMVVSHIASYQWFHGAQRNTPRIKPAINYVTSATKPVKYEIGSIVYLFSRPDLNTGMSIFDRFQAIYEVKEIPL